MPMDLPSTKITKNILSKIRHDLTNPINAIIGYSELLLDIIGENLPTLKDDVFAILKSGQTLLSDIKSIFSFDDSENKELGELLSSSELQYTLRISLTTIIGLSEFIIEEKSYLENKEMIMASDGLIDLDNTSGKFKIFGMNSQLMANDIKIIGEDIKGRYININGENKIENLQVSDKKQTNIKTETLSMFALKAEFNNKANIIELFDEVKIIRNNEIIVGDYAKINTLDESYKIKSKESKKVKVLLKKNNE